MAPEKSSSKPIVLVALLAVIAVTIAAAFLLGGPGDQPGKFFLTLGALVFAEIAVFSLPLLSGNVPTLSGVGIFALVYAAGVAALLFIALTPISFTVLVVLHAIWLVILFIGVGATMGAGKHRQTMLAKDVEQREAMVEIGNGLDDINDQLALATWDEAAALKERVAELRLKVRDTLPRSPAGGENADDDVAAALNKLSGLVNRLDKTTAAEGTIPGSDRAAVERAIQEFDQALERRERAINQSRPRE